MVLLMVTLLKLILEIVLKNNKLTFVLDDKRKNIHFEIEKESLSHCVEGQKVLVKVIKELKNNLYLAKIDKVLGHKNDPGVDILSIAALHEINYEFSNEVMKQVAKQEKMLKMFPEIKLCTTDGEVIITTFPPMTSSRRSGSYAGVRFIDYPPCQERAPRNRAEHPPPEPIPHTVPEPRPSRQEPKTAPGKKSSFPRKAQG